MSTLYTIKSENKIEKNSNMGEGPGATPPNIPKLKLSAHRITT